LRFLGRVDEARIDSIFAPVLEVLASQTSFDVSIRGIGAYPSRRVPRVLWAGIGEGRQKIVELHDTLSGPLERGGFPSENRRYSPHVTVGRIRRRVASRRHRAASRVACRSSPLEALLGALRDRDPSRIPEGADRDEIHASFCLSFITLFESRLSPGRPPEYVPRRRYPFDASR